MLDEEVPRPEEVQVELQDVLELGPRQLPVLRWQHQQDLELTEDRLQLLSMIGPIVVLAGEAGHIFKTPWRICIVSLRIVA